MAIRRNVAALRLCDLQKVAAHAGQADSLGRRRSFVRRGHLLQEKVINPEEDRGGYQNSSKSGHRRIVALPDASRKRRAWAGALRTTAFFSTSLIQTCLLNFTLPSNPLPGVSPLFGPTNEYACAAARLACP